MFIKSKIQLIREQCKLTSDYKDHLTNLMEKYNIEDSIFIYTNSQIFEVTKGYFEKISECNSLLEALAGCNNRYSNIGIRIMENKRFEIGYIRKSLAECGQDSNIFDIECLTDVR